MNFERNNLDLALSPYLKQHADNPIWWQEWTPDVLEQARRADKPLLASVGYATCHWCHVMARGAFSHPDVAALLNRDFVCIKVDREQRPDIDQYLMDFLVATTGSGGWPLNAFLTPDGRPFFAMTYAAPEAIHNIPPFQEILRRVVAFYREKKDDVMPFEPSGVTIPSSGLIDDRGVTAAIKAAAESYDRGDGGLSGHQKFPPHCPNLFLLYATEAVGAGDNAPEGSETGLAVQSARKALERTFDAMTYRGLHDHVGGGFFRYCVDPGWQIPHFEKMLYDQAMMLWGLSVAARSFSNDWYRRAAIRTYECLERDFRQQDLYISSHDADTDHEEGATYLWTVDELKEILGTAEWKGFEETFTITEGGNCEGRNHLVINRSNALTGSGLSVGQLDPLLGRLLSVRQNRPQPERDEKLITSWNALAGIALLQLSRHLDVGSAATRAREIFDTLVGKHMNNGDLAHSSLNGKLQNERFLGDYASLLLFATYLAEEEPVAPEMTAALSAGVESFYRGGGPLEAENVDFRPIPAGGYDMPIPSSLSLAEMAKLRANIQHGTPYDGFALSGSVHRSFLDLSALLAGGFFLEVESQIRQPWNRLPIHTIQKRGPDESYCYRGVCRPGLPKGDEG